MSWRQLSLSAFILALGTTACSSSPAPTYNVDTTLNDEVPAETASSSTEVHPILPATPSQPATAHGSPGYGRDWDGEDTGEPLPDTEEAADAEPSRPISQAAGLEGNPGQFFGPDAYPAAAIRAGAQGRVVARLSVGTDGRVENCEITSSSSNDDLDSTTCRIAISRIRFRAARDDSGNPMRSTYTLPVRWSLPSDD